MDRRGFLQRLMLGAAALAVDPEQLLWTPEKKTIFIPEAAPFDSWGAVDARRFFVAVRKGLPPPEFRRLNMGVAPTRTKVEVLDTTIGEYRQRFGLSRAEFAELFPYAVPPLN